MPCLDARIISQHSLQRLRLLDPVKILEEVGFEQVQRYDWRETEHAAIDDYSQAYIAHMDKKRGVQISLNVECVEGRSARPSRAGGAQGARSAATET